MNILFKVSQQTLWQILGKAISSLSTIFILGIVTRFYGEEGTGVLTLSLTLLAFFALAVDFGINPYLLPRFLKDDFTLEWQKLLGLRIILSGLLVGLASLVIFLWPGQNTDFKIITLLGLISIFESAVFLTANIIFQARLRYDLSISGVLGMLITLAVVFFVSTKNLPLPYLISGYITGWVFSGALALFLAKKYLNNLLPVFDPGYIKKIITGVWPVSATLVLNVVYFRLDAFMLSFYKGFSDVGIYNLSYQIFQSVLVLPTFIMNGFYPLMLKDLSANMNLFKLNLGKTILVMFLLSLGTAVFTLIFSPSIVAIITAGRGFSGSTQSLQILSLSFPAFFVSSVLMWTLVALKRYKIMLVIYSIGLFFNATMNFFLIPTYSYIASSWITGASEYLILILQVFILIPELKRKK